MIIDSVFRMTEERLQELKDELHYLQTVREKEVALRVKDARMTGGVLDNSEYDEAKTEQSNLYYKIAELKQVIDNAQIVDQSGNVRSSGDSDTPGSSGTTQERSQQMAREDAIVIYDWAYHLAQEYGVTDSCNLTDLDSFVVRFDEYYAIFHLDDKSVSLLRSQCGNQVYWALITNYKEINSKFPEMTAMLLRNGIYLYTYYNGGKDLKVVDISNFRHLRD